MTRDPRAQPALPTKQLACWDCGQSSPLPADPDVWGLWMEICDVCGAENWVSRTCFDALDPVPGFPQPDLAMQAAAEVSVPAE